jgi:hypothetical protein
MLSVAIDRGSAADAVLVEITVQLRSSGCRAASNEPPPKIIIDPPLAEPLFAWPVGPAALAVSRRVGHII